MRTVVLLWCLLIFGAATVNAEPVYLNCQLNDSGGVIWINVTLDEATQQVTFVVLHTGHTQRTTGIFSAETVFFATGVGSSTEIQYTINRLTLEIQRIIPRIKYITGGTCSIEQAPKNRKF